MKTGPLITAIIVLITLAGPARAEPFNVIFVTASSAADEQDYTEFLQEIYRGNVTVHIDPDRYDEDLSDKKKLELEAADLIIVSADIGSRDYNGDSDFWNAINVPILNHSIKLARSDDHKFWDWLEGDRTSYELCTHLAVADCNDPIFAGVDTSSGMVQMFTTGQELSYSDQASAGTGTVTATSDANVAIARWLGTEASYYDGSDYAPGAARLFFTMPEHTSEFFNDATDEAELMLRNAILSFLPVNRPTGDLDDDGDVDFDDLAIFSNYWADTNCAETLPCNKANLAGDDTISAEDLNVLVADWLTGADVTPPEPNVMTWQTEPTTTSTASIYMAATPACDEMYGVEYYFECTSGNGPDSGRQYNNAFEPNTLTVGTEYTYRVKAHDTSGNLNETEWSNPATARTFGIYREIADASAAVAVDANLFIAAGDETNRLSIYNFNDVGSRPIMDVNIADLLHIEPSHPESDIEGATWLNDKIFWITSHGRNKDGEYQYSRYQLFATTVVTDGQDINVTVVGNYCNLIDDLIAYDSVYELGLADAIGVSDGHIDPNEIPDLAPKKDGLNIEGLCATADGNCILIGFRNPRPKIDDVKRALIIPIVNAEEVVLSGAPAQFEPPLLLDLDGLGIRSMEYSPTLGEYLVIAGSHKSGSDEPLQI